MSSTFWRTVVAIQGLLLMFTAIGAFRLGRQLDAANTSAAKFDDYCQGVRATAGVVLTDLDNEKWRAGALERFSTRVDDFNRCTTRVLSWEHFNECKLRGDQPCIATFVRETRDAITVTP